MGFRRHPVYAPLKQRDLRIGHYIYLELTQPVKAHAAIEVTYQGTTVPDEIAAIPNMFTLMTRDAECAHAANRPTASTVARS